MEEKDKKIKQYSNQPEKETKNKSNPKTVEQENAKDVNKTKQDALNEMHKGISETAKAKSKKKKLVAIISAVVALIFVGVAIALFFMLKPAEELPHVIADVSVLHYSVEGDVAYVEGREVISFTAEDEVSTRYSQDIDTVITATTYARLMYVIDNLTSEEYVYTLSFENLVYDNVLISCYTNKNPAPVQITYDNRSMQIQDAKDLSITIEVKVDNYGADALFNGNIYLTLAVVQ